MIFCVVLIVVGCTLILIFKIGDNLLEIVFAERGKDFFLVFFANNDVTI